MNLPPPKSLYDVFYRRNLRFKEGKGTWLISDKGEYYLDFTSGVSVNILGHVHPKLVEALKKQAERLWHVSNLFQSPEQEALAERLCANSFADRVFFCNSGAEALECAIKTARRYHYASHQPKRVDIISFEDAFHGRTLATLAATGREQYLEGFGPKVGGFVQVPFSNEEALRHAINDETAAILIEPIQGEGGIRTVSYETLKLLRQVCDENDLLLILDEVQTGIGRTGKLFAYEWSEIAPDILTLAKGLGGGFPLGACLATNEAAKGMTPGTHGSTFGGNLLGMAVSNSVLDVILEPNTLKHAQAMAHKLKLGLEAIRDTYPDVIGTIRGVGLMLGIQCMIPQNELIRALDEAYILTLSSSNNTIRLLPPITITEEEVHEGLHRITKAVNSLSYMNKN